MLEAQEFDENDEMKRDALKGKFLIQNHFSANEFPTVSRDRFSLAKRAA